MAPNFKKLIQDAFTRLKIGYKVVRGIDYRTLSHYIVRINQYKNIEEILHEVAHCFKNILDYELFGFALQDENTIEVWIDPRAYRDSLLTFVKKDFNGQNIDYVVHHLDRNSAATSQKTDVCCAANLASFTVTDGKFSARLYILPRRKLLSYHANVINIIISSIKTALANSIRIQKLENVAAVDSLTGCYNRRALSTYLEKDVAYARRYGNDLSVIMFDLDDFKKINDTYGHEAGDTVLTEVCAMVGSLVRKSDYMARYGGEEFVLVLHDTTQSNAVQLAEKLRKKIKAYSIGLNSATISVTASFGVACLRSNTDSAGLLREADEMLYKAKARGKNRVVPAHRPYVMKENRAQAVRALQCVDGLKGA